MAKETVVIDVVARFINKTSQGVQEFKKDLAESAGKADKLGDSLDKTRKQVEKLTKSKWTMRLEMMDSATSKLSRISSSITGFAGKTFKFGVRILDYATRPLRGIYNFATSLKGVLTGILVGKAGQTMVSQPLGLADAYSNAHVGFKTLFQDDKRAQKMMNDIDTFAKETPFKTSNVIEQTQRMLAMGWDADRLIPDMETIGNAASATGRGDEGLQRIILALSQIKSKGKLSTEELNQLAEAGINAKAYISEGLGYGRTDEGLAKLASDLQGGRIGGNAAVEMILEGMKEYNGMMQRLSKETASGIMSNISDTFEISIIRKWGQGLQEGAIKGLGTFADFLDKNEDKLNKLGDTAKGIAAKMSNWFADSAEFITDKILTVTESAEFKNAGLGGKVRILWDEIIAEPFSDWWSKNSVKMASSIGHGLGTGLKGIITGVFGFGIDNSGIADEAMSAGAAFAKSFLDGFDPAEVGRVVWDGIKNIFDNAPPWAQTLLGAFAVKKGTDIASPMISGGKTLVQGVSSAKEWLVGAGTAGTAATGGAAAGSTAGAATLTTTAATAITAAGWIAGALGLVDAGKDLAKGFNSENKKTARDNATKGVTKAGMVATGAGAGALIGSFVPVIGTAIGAAIGAGIGGLGAIFGGDSLGQWVSDLSDGTKQIRDATSNMVEARDAFSQSIQKDVSVNSLISEYETLTKKLEDTKLSAEEHKGIQERINEVVRELADLYPNLITQQDVLNGKIGAQLNTIKAISAMEREQARWELEKQVKDAKETYEKKDIGQKIKDSEAQLAYDKQQMADAEKALTAYSALNAEIEKLQLESDQAMRDGDMSFFSSESYNGKLESLEKRMQEITQGTGLHYKGVFEFAMDFPDDLHSKMGQYIDSIAEEQKRNQELKQSEIDLFNAQKTLIENQTGLNGTIEQSAANFDKLDEAQRDALKDAIEQVKELQREFENLPAEVKIPISIEKMVYGEIAGGITRDTNGKQSYTGGRNGITLSEYANGGILTRPHLGLVAEAGAEAIIPLSSSKRNRGLDLWEKAGRAMGVLPYADGGIVGSIQPYTVDNRISYTTDGAFTQPIQVNLGGMQFSFNGANVQNPESIMQAIRDQMPQVANEVCEAIAILIKQSFGNLAAAQI